jgi:hypothetical protein
MKRSAQNFTCRISWLTDALVSLIGSVSNNFLPPLSKFSLVQTL